MTNLESNDNCLVLQISPKSCWRQLLYAFHSASTYCNTHQVINHETNQFFFIKLPYIDITSSDCQLYRCITGKMQCNQWLPIIFYWGESHSQVHRQCTKKWYYENICFFTLVLSFAWRNIGGKRTNLWMNSFNWPVVDGAMCHGFDSKEKHAKTNYCNIHKDRYIRQCGRWRSC